MKVHRATEPSIALVEERDEDETPSAVVIARVADPAKLLDDRSRRMHGDVVDALVDLVVALLDEEGARDEGPSR